MFHYMLIALLLVTSGCVEERVKDSNKRDISIDGAVSKISSEDLQYQNAMNAIKQKEYKKARELLAPLALINKNMARFNLALMYEKGLGGAIDYEKARGLYESSADSGNPYAQLNLGTMNENGYGFTHRSMWEATGWYYRAGLTFLEEGNVEGAKIALNTLLQASPKSPFAGKLKALIKEKEDKGKKDES